MAVQKVGQQCHPVIHLLLATITTVATIAHHMERIHQAMITPDTTTIRHIIANHLLTGVVMPQLLPAMHLHILVCCSLLTGHFDGYFLLMELC